MKKDNKTTEYLTIKQFAEYTGLSASALRHYDNNGVFRPAGHGPGLANQYRLYSPMQITTVKMIRILVEIGVPLKTIQELAKDRSPEKLIRLLSKSKEKLSGEIRFLNNVYGLIDTFTELLNEAMRVTETDISLAEMPERNILLGDCNDFGDEPGFFHELARFYMTPHIPRLHMSYPVGGYFESMDVFLADPRHPTRFFSLDPRGGEQKLAGLYLIGYTRGYYGQTGNLPARMTAFAKKHGLVFGGPVYNIYLADELSILDPSQYLLQASAAVTETRHLPERRPKRLMWQDTAGE